MHYGLGMYYGLGAYRSMVWLFLAMIFAMYAQSKVSLAYGRYAKISCGRGVTGAQVARRILDYNGLSDVSIEIVPGKLSDHYDPRKRIMRLSSAVYHDSTIASISIAAHESGHAIQHSCGYLPLQLRNGIAPVVSLVSNLSWPLLMIGLFMGTSSQGSFLFNLGVLFFCGAVVFQAVTLPVEFNASRRAVEQLSELNLILPTEKKGAKKMLSAAAMTYVAALAMAIANLLRILSMRRRD